MTDDFATSHSKSSAVEPQLDTEVSDSSDATTAGSDDEVEPDSVNAPLLRSTDGGIRDESTRYSSLCRQAYTLGTHRPEIISH